MAKAFRFRLETVRRLRAMARDRERRAVAGAAREVAESERLRAALDQNLNQSVEQMRSRRREGPLDVASIRAAYLHEGRLMRTRAEVEVELYRRRTRLAAAQQTLSEASAKLKGIEKLRERQWQRHQALLESEEQQVYDEATLRQYTLAAQASIGQNETACTRSAGGVLAC